MPENENEQSPPSMPPSMPFMDAADTGYEKWAREYLGDMADEVGAEIHMLLLGAFRAGWAGGAEAQADPESVGSVGIGFVGLAGYEAELSVELNGMKGACYISHLFFESIKEHWDKATQAEHGLGYQACLALDEANFNAGLPNGSTPIPSAALPPGHTGDHRCPCGKRWLVRGADAD
jgi:hypothetical protein